jgi:drug/metabolite transporter (DMT)-like permease
MNSVREVGGSNFNKTSTDSMDEVSQENMISTILPKLSKRTTGMTLAILGVLALTPESILIRKVEHVPMFTVLFYRNSIFTAFLITYLFINNGWNSFHKLYALGRWGVFAGLVFGSNLLLLFIALATSSAASVLVIQASNPVFAALFSWYILGERVSNLTLGTSLVCISAIALIFVGQAVEESNDDGHSGNSGLFCAVGSSVTFGLYVVLLRWLSVGKE